MGTSPTEKPANRPPRDITPAGFFTDWLPAEFAAEFGPGLRKAADITVAVRLEGEGGGEWVIDVRDDQLRVRAPEEPGPPPLVSLRQTVADWRAVAVGEEGAVNLAPPAASALDVLFVDPASRLVLEAVEGTVRFEVEGYNGRTWWMEVKFGTHPHPAQPDALMLLDAETYAQVLDRRLAPVDAYFSGKIQLRGNTSLALKFAMATLPRFTT